MHAELKPELAFERWLLGIIAVETVRLDRCRLHEIALRAEQAHSRREVVGRGPPASPPRNWPPRRVCPGGPVACARPAQADLQGSRLLVLPLVGGPGPAPWREAGGPRARRPWRWNSWASPPVLLDGEANPLMPGPWCGFPRPPPGGRGRGTRPPAAPDRRGPPGPRRARVGRRRKGAGGRGLAAAGSLLHRYETASLRRLQWVQRQLRSLSREVRPADRAEGRPPLAATEARFDEAIPAAEVQRPAPAVVPTASEPARAVGRRPSRPSRPGRSRRRSSSRWT